MKNNMIERYIYAVVKNLPSKIRGDVEEELRVLITDMVEERCSMDLASDEDIKAVLTELGNPYELAQKYSQDENDSLIGFPYYENYKMVLKIVLISVAFGMALAGLITNVINSTATAWYVAIGEWFSMIFMGLASAFAFVTLIFAVFQRKGVNINLAPYEIDQLPAVPKEQEIIKIWEPILGIALSVIFTVIFLVSPQMIAGIFIKGRAPVPLFNLAELGKAQYLVLSFCGLGILRESFKIYEGRYTKRLGAVSVITNILAAICSFAFLFQNKILNEEFVSNISILFDSEGLLISFTNINLFFLAVILFALSIDTLIAVIKGMKYSGE